LKTALDNKDIMTQLYDLSAAFAPPVVNITSKNIAAQFLDIKTSLMPLGVDTTTTNVMSRFSNVTTVVALAFALTAFYLYWRLIWLTYVPKGIPMIGTEKYNLLSRGRAAIFSVFHSRELCEAGYAKVSLRPNRSQFRICVNGC
jgi:uncharacterized Fe-S cluster-containing radical SAM superfamily enzyme